MRVENPEFVSLHGEVNCSNCPLDENGLNVTCHDWWSRKGAPHDLICPTVDTYEEACLMAEEAAKGGKG